MFRLTRAAPRAAFARPLRTYGTTGHAGKAWHAQRNYAAMMLLLVPLGYWAYLRGRPAEALADKTPRILEKDVAVPVHYLTEEDLEAKPPQAYDPVTGEINWDCPCLGGMANGPCGEDFKAAFSCFIYSQDEPKGAECIGKFRAMQDCFRQHPEVYAEQLDIESGVDQNIHHAGEKIAAGTAAAGKVVQEEIDQLQGDAGAFKDAAAARVDQARQTLKSKASDVQSSLGSADNEVKRSVNKGQKKAGELKDSVKKSVAVSAQDLQKAAESAADASVNTLDTAQKKAREHVGDVKRSVSKGASNLGEGAKDARDSAEAQAKDIADKLLAQSKAAKQSVDASLASLKEQVESNSKSLKDGAQSEFGSLQQLLADTQNSIKNNLAELQRNALEARHSSEESLKGLESQVASQVSNLRDSSSASIGNLKDQLNSAVSSAKSTTSSYYDATVDQTEQLKKSARATFSNARDSAKGAYGNVESGVSGLSDAVRHQIEEAQKSGQSLYDAAASSLRDFESSIGEQLSQAQKSAQNLYQKSGNKVQELQDQIGNKLNATYDDTRADVSELQKSGRELYDTANRNAAEYDRKFRKVVADKVSEGQDKANGLYEASGSKAQELTDQISNQLNEKYDMTRAQVRKIQDSGRELYHSTNRKAVDYDREFRKNVAEKVDDAQKSAQDLYATSKNVATEYQEQTNKRLDEGLAAARKSGEEYAKELQSLGNDAVANAKKTGQDSLNAAQAKTKELQDAVSDKSLKAQGLLDSALYDKRGNSNLTDEDYKIRSPAEEDGWSRLKSNLQEEFGEDTKKFQHQVSESFTSPEARERWSKHGADLQKNFDSDSKKFQHQVNESFTSPEAKERWSKYEADLKKNFDSDSRKFSDHVHEMVAPKDPQQDKGFVGNLQQKLSDGLGQVDDELAKFSKPPSESK